VGPESGRASSDVLSCAGGGNQSRGASLGVRSGLVGCAGGSGGRRDSAEAGAVGRCMWRNRDGSWRRGIRCSSRRPCLRPNTGGCSPSSGTASRMWTSRRRVGRVRRSHHDHRVVRRSGDPALRARTEPVGLQAGHRGVPGAGDVQREVLRPPVPAGIVRDCARASAHRPALRAGQPRIQGWAQGLRAEPGDWIVGIWRRWTGISR
jgi:hypothetical protein